MDDGDRSRFAELLKQLECLSIAHKRLVDIALLQSKSGEISESDSFAPLILELSVDVERQLIFRSCLGILTLSGQHVGEVRMENASLSLHGRGRLELIEHRESLAMDLFGQIVAATGFVASAKTEECDSTIYAQFISQLGEDGYKDLGGFGRPAREQQLFEPCSIWPVIHWTGADLAAGSLRPLAEPPLPRV